MRYFNKWKADKTAEGEIYHMTVGGILLSTFVASIVKFTPPEWKKSGTKSCLFKIRVRAYKLS